MPRHDVVGPTRQELHGLQLVVTYLNNPKLVEQLSEAQVRVKYGSWSILK